MPGKHRNDRESKTWFYSSDAVTMSSMHRRRWNKSVSIKKYLPANHHRCIGDASQAPSDYVETCLRLYGNQPLVPIMVVDIDVVLVTFKVSLFPYIHFLRFSSSVFMDFVISSILLDAYAQLVSSAYMVTLESCSESGMSLMNNRNNRGPRQDPCSTPHLIF